MKKDPLDDVLVAYVGALQHASYDALDAARGAAVNTAGANLLDRLASGDMLDTEPADIEAAFEAAAEAAAEAAVERETRA